ncbi:hypothetical protein QTP88_028667 [Uroleucon formosanum]
MKFDCVLYSQRTNITEVALGLSDKDNVEKIYMTFQLSLNQLEYSEIVSDIVERKRGNNRDVESVNGYEGPNVKAENQRCPLAIQQTTCIGQILAKGGHTTFVKLRVVGYSSAANLVIKNEHIEIVCSKMSPVQQPVMIPPRQIEGNFIEEMSAGSIDIRDKSKRFCNTAGQLQPTDQMGYYIEKLKINHGNPKRIGDFKTPEDANKRAGPTVLDKNLVTYYRRILPAERTAVFPTSVHTVLSNSLFIVVRRLKSTGLEVRSQSTTSYTADTP